MPRSTAHRISRSAIVLLLATIAVVTLPRLASSQDIGPGVRLDSVVIDTILGQDDSVVVEFERKGLYRVAVAREAGTFSVRHINRREIVAPFEITAPEAALRIYELSPSRSGPHVVRLTGRGRVAVYAVVRNARARTVSPYRFDIGLVIAEYVPGSAVLEHPEFELKHERAFAFGLRFATRLRGSPIGVEAAVYRVRADVSGNIGDLTPPGLEPIAITSTTSYFADVRLLYYLTPADGPMEAALGGGIGIVWREADSFLAGAVGTSSFGGVLGARLRIPVAQSFGVLLTVEDHIYGLGDDGEPETSSPTQHDFFLGAGLTLRF